MMEWILLGWMIAGMALDGYTTLQMPHLNKRLENMEVRELNMLGIHLTTYLKPAIVLLCLCGYWWNTSIGIFLMSVFGALWGLQGLNNMMAHISTMNSDYTIGELKVEIKELTEEIEWLKKIN